VYLDGGHSAWNGASDQANRLRAAGVQFADGFYTNVSNYNGTGNEANYGRSIIAALNGFGITGKRQIIDTSRNGGASGDWCGDDNTDRRIGQYPTTNTGDANIDGYVWVKPPGEADGCRYAAGSFVPELAFSLANGAPNPPTTTPPVITPPVTTPPVTTPPATTPPATTPPVTTPPATTPPATTPPATTPPVTTPPPSGVCSATYQTIRSWQGGFQGEVTVTAGAAGVSRWTVTWTPAAGQAITQVWSGTLAGTSPTVRVTNASWNGTIPPSGSTMFGFLANGNPSNPVLTCTNS
jgi:endoglucanase